MMSQEVQNLLDIATKIAISASAPGEKGKAIVDASTINNLISFLQSRRNVNELLVYIMRQWGRGEIDERTAKLLLSNLKSMSVEQALELLGFVKWVYETLNSKEVRIDYRKISNIEKFEKLVEALSK